MLLEMNVKLHRGHFDLTTRLSISDSSAGLFGKSGAGKITVLGLIAGTIQPQSGRIAVRQNIVRQSQRHHDAARARPGRRGVADRLADSAGTVRDNLTALITAH